MQFPYLGKFSFSRFISENSQPIRLLDFSNYYIFCTVQPFFIIVCIKIEYHKTFKMVLSFFYKNAHFANFWHFRSFLTGNGLSFILLNIGSLYIFLDFFSFFLFFIVFLFSVSKVPGVLCFFMLV